MIGVGVIGYGYWGPNLVRNFAGNAGTRVIAVCDQSPARLAAAVAGFPGVRGLASPEELIANPMVDAVAVATPVESHYPLALAALRAGKHVFVEKPITSTADQARHLIDEATRRGLTLHVDHTFVYTGAVRKMREIIVSPAFGRVQYYDSSRVNLGLFQHDVNVLWDLAVHDLSIMNHVLDARPEAVSATGLSHVEGQPENIAFLTLFFPEMIGHVNVNWLSPVKMRRTLVGGSGQMIVYDDLETTEKIKVYDKGITITETPEEIRKLRIGYRTGDLWSPKVSDAEALGVEIEHFAACIRGREPSLTGGEVGLELVQILEAANRSLAARGAPVEL